MPALPGSLAWQRVAAHSTVLDYHLSMVHDTARMEAFRRAIDASVRPGDVVVDLGCGSGVLSFMACEAGAAKVYAIEGGPVIDVAQELAVDNGFDDRIEFLGGWSMEVGIPERADVLISETIGNAGFDEGIVAWTVDARRRLLRPDAVLLPQRLRLWVAAAESFDDHAVVSDWQAPSLPYDCSAAYRRAARTLWYSDLTSNNLLGQAELAADVDLRCATDQTIRSSGTLVVERDGVLHGMACWFDSLLSPGVTVDNMPEHSESSWSHGFLPLAEPLAVNPGDRFAWDLAVSPDGDQWRWHLDRIEG
ncbi:MAG TPA: 50S ribosomal protein L11 methyltransferase [Microthrixaceae bacterium]|jgi:protein arginine N-methyltransferase 1|nr:50S ribosomal protein L11 methyltransferase [Microthrixaceae bacterium]